MINIVKVASLNDPQLNPYARLTDHALRVGVEQGMGLFIAETHYVIEAALRLGFEPCSLLVTERRLASLKYLLQQLPSGTPVFVISEDESEKLAGYRITRGVLAAMKRPSARTVAELAQSCRRLVILEDLVDASNVGAALRSASALGADGMILSPHCADPLCRRAVRTSMGTALSLPWAVATEEEWPELALETLHKTGFELLALALTKDAQPLRSFDQAGERRRALLFGTEGTGLSAQTLAICDKAVVIPMANGADSLNVAASAALACWHLFGPVPSRETS